MSISLSDNGGHEPVESDWETTASFPDLGSEEFAHDDPGNGAKTSWEEEDKNAKADQGEQG